MSKRCPLSVSFCVVAIFMIGASYLIADWHSVTGENIRYTGENGENYTQQKSISMGLTHTTITTEGCPDNEDECIETNEYLPNDEALWSSDALRRPKLVRCGWFEDQLNELEEYEAEGLLIPGEEEHLELMDNRMESCLKMKEANEMTSYFLYGAMGIGVLSMILIILSNFGFMPNWISMIFIYLLCLGMAGTIVYYFLMFPSLGTVLEWGVEARLQERPGTSIYLGFASSFFALLAGTTAMGSEDD